MFVLAGFQQAVPWINQVTTRRQSLVGKFVLEIVYWSKRKPFGYILMCCRSKVLLNPILNLGILLRFVVSLKRPRRRYALFHHEGGSRMREPKIIIEEINFSLLETNSTQRSCNDL